MKTYRISAEKVLACGPLESMFPCSSTKILDFLLVHSEYDYSISDLARFSGVSVKSALREVSMLMDMGILKKPRIVGKAESYRVSRTSALARQINRMAINITMQRYSH